MQPPVPTRITIELQPAPDVTTWTAANVAASTDSTFGAQASEPRESMLAPAAYEPEDCTCLEGLCNDDHANA